MSFSSVIEVGVGLILVYYILSLMTSTVTSWITEGLQIRANNLFDGLQDLLGDSEKLQDLLNHPWVENLKPKRVGLIGGVTVTRRLAILPSGTFARTLLEILAPSEKSGEALKKLRASVTALPEGRTKQQLTGLVNQGVEKVEDVRKNFEAWFNDALINITSLYGQHARRIALVIASIITLVLNVDSFDIVVTLWNAPAERAVAAAAADQALAADVDSESISDYVERLEGLHIPLFWTPESIPQTPKDWALKTVGLASTAAAVSLGSPFWYDVLKRLRGSSSTPTPAK